MSDYKAFLGELRLNEIEPRLMWSAKRWPDETQDSVFFYALSGPSKISTLMIIDYGRDGFGLFPESRNSNVTGDLIDIVECAPHQIQRLPDTD